MSERITLVNPYVIYECPDCGVRVATDSPDSVPDCPDCGLLGVALEFVGLGEFISAESKTEIERLRRERETLAEALRELVTLKDRLKHADPAEYERRKPQAWQAAREALERVQETGVILTADDCNILMHGLRDQDELEGHLIPEALERYGELCNRIIDVGTGYAGGVEGA